MKLLKCSFCQISIHFVKKSSSISQTFRCFPKGLPLELLCTWFICSFQGIDEPVGILWKCNGLFLFVLYAGYWLYCLCHWNANHILAFYLNPFGVAETDCILSLNVSAFLLTTCTCMTLFSTFLMWGGEQRRRLLNIYIFLCFNWRTQQCKK